MTNNIFRQINNSTTDTDKKSENSPYLLKIASDEPVNRRNGTYDILENFDETNLQNVSENININPNIFSNSENCKNASLDQCSEVYHAHSAQKILRNRPNVNARLYTKKLEKPLQQPPSV